MSMPSQVLSKPSRALWHTLGDSVSKPVGQTRPWAATWCSLGLTLGLHIIGKDGSEVITRGGDHVCVSLLAVITSLESSPPGRSQPSFSPGLGHGPARGMAPGGYLLLTACLGQSVLRFLSKDIQPGFYYYLTRILPESILAKIFLNKTTNGSRVQYQLTARSRSLSTTWGI